MTAAPSLHSIRAVVASHFGIGEDDLCGPSRAAEFAHPRQIAFYIARAKTAASLNRVGRSFGGRDHSTVLHGARKVEAEIATDPTTAEDVKRIIRALRRKVAQ